VFRNAAGGSNTSEPHGPVACLFPPFLQALPWLIEWSVTYASVKCITKGQFIFSCNLPDTIFSWQESPPRVTVLRFQTTAAPVYLPTTCDNPDVSDFNGTSIFIHHVSQSWGFRPQWYQCAYLPRVTILMFQTSAVLVYSYTICHSSEVSDFSGTSILTHHVSQSWGFKLQQYEFTCLPRVTVLMLKASAVLIYLPNICHVLKFQTSAVLVYLPTTCHNPYVSDFSGTVLIAHHVSFLRFQISSTLARFSGCDVSTWTRYITLVKANY
jgi:hypothetical protein